MGQYTGKSRGTGEALVVPTGPTGPVRVVLGNPNTTGQVTGALYKRNKEKEEVNYYLTGFIVDAKVSTELLIGGLTEAQLAYLTLDAVPSAEITIEATW